MIYDIRKLCSYIWIHTRKEKNTAAGALSTNIYSDTEAEKCTAICNVVELTALDETEISTEQRKEENWKELIKYQEHRNKKSPNSLQDLK